MKTKLLSAIILLSGVAILFNACKKSESAKPATTTATTKQTAGAQIALNLYHSLTGQFGGINVYNGISTPSVPNSTSTVKVNSTNYACGFYINNGISYNTNIGDTIKSSTTGGLSFYYVCNNGSAIGYTAQDTLTTVGTAPGYSFIDGLSQNYKVTGLNPNNSLVTVDGLIQATIVLDRGTKGGKSLTYNSFTLSGLQVHLDQTPPDITSGTAVFVATGLSGTTAYALYGTLTFLGNHMAKVDYYDSIYYVNLLTGKISATI
ncbi:hypothetical protein [uncultured Mucilaginibacter sp.]|uniref:hypothetical protein n=1 Tax=uncultured Mucilaginibacter sp. TaxID=797541 RepID=UPI0025F314CB|nr:hypothetical protein [uncultured Mucilaginibacter sp.]